LLDSEEALQDPRLILGFLFKKKWAFGIASIWFPTVFLSCHLD
jgi:hypothetical protein